MATVQRPELGFYVLAGAPESNRVLLDEVREAEEMGLGTAFISERWNIKEAATLTGAAAAVTSTIRIATAATNHNTRHPLITGSWAATMHTLTEGRFDLGVGRGVRALFDAFGVPAITTAQMEDFAGVMRRLWHGETIVGHDGPIGSYPALMLDRDFDFDIPLGLVAFGRNTLELAGRAFDYVVLHTFFTDETLQRCVRTVKDAAEKAGRDPDAVTVWSCYATVGDHLSDELRLRKTVGRLATYLQLYGRLMVETNRWDPAVLDRFLADDLVASFGHNPIDGKATIADLELIGELIPDEWLAPAANGTPAQCAADVRRQLDLGADRVILHGATPSELAPILAAYQSE